MQTTRSALSVAVLIVLASCGGGGGGGGGSSMPSVPTTPLQITAANMQAVAGGATLSGLGAASAGGLFRSALKIDRALPRTHVLAQIIKRQIAPAVLQSVQLISAATTTCATGNGTTTVNQTSSTSVTVIFTSCSDAPGETLDGTVTVVNINTTGAGFTGTASIGLTLKQTGVPDFSISGGSIAISDSTNGDVDTVTMSGTQLLATTGSVAESLGNYSFSSVFDNTAQSETDTITLDYANTGIGGQVHVTTFIDPVTAFASDFPHSGALMITGTQGSQMHVLINGDEGGAPPQVTIQLDADGNGTIDTTLNKNWSDLDV